MYFSGDCLLFLYENVTMQEGTITFSYYVSGVEGKIIRNYIGVLVHNQHHI